MPDEQSGRVEQDRPFSAEERVRILMFEYTALRTEIVHRTNNGFQLLTVGGAVVVWLLSRIHDVETLQHDWAFWIACAIAAIAIGVAIWFAIRDIRKAHNRLLEIEADVNRRAGEIDLLQWETYWAAFSTGFWGLSRPKRRGSKTNVVR